MKTPIAYYGGKQQLAGKIVRILAQAPAQKIYCEPFFGGGAVFFARGGAEHEVINDANRNLVTFWEVLQKDFPALKREIDATLHSRDAYRHALVVLENPDMFDKVKTAWAVWTASNESYGHKWGAGFAYGRVCNMARKTARSREALTEELAERIGSAVIECCDALRVIESRDTPETLFYLDPPYPGTNQGMYDGYSQTDFENLLEVLSGCKGNFLLSSFRNGALDVYARRFGWTQAEFKMHKSMTSSARVKAQKIEVVTGNFPFATE